MPDELEQRIQRALQADVADRPMAIVPSMVEERLDRTVRSGIGVPLLGGAVAAALMLIFVGTLWLPGRVPSTPGGSAAPPTAVAPGIANCPVAQPGQAPAEIGEQLFGSGRAWGNDELWVGGLGDGGVIDAGLESVAEDGSIGWKLGWWRDVRGNLAISGRRLDAQAPPLGARVPEGYGSFGFQASGVSFPTEGCWEITGRVGEAQLTFVTYVIDLQAEIDMLFSDTQTCEVSRAGVDLEVTYPATWFTSEPTADQQGCGRFSSEPIETEPTSSGLEGAGVFLAAVGGPEGPRLPSEEELDRQHRRVADLKAMRVEVLDSETGVRSLTYWIAAGPDPEGGPTIVAATYSVGVGSYILNKAVLDRMMEELAANASPTSSARAAETPSASPTASAEPNDVPIPAEFTERTELPSCGHEVVERTPEGDFHDAEATACFLAAYEAGDPAEFISESRTVEGGRITTVFRILGPGQIEIFADSTQDFFSTHGWTRTVCDSILEIAQDPNGVPILIGDQCEEPVVLSD